MVLRFGGKNPLVNTRVLAQQLIPQNRGMHRIANNKIEQATSQAARKTVEAVRTNGIRALVWNRMPRGSIKCTCCSNRNAVAELTNRPADRNAYNPDIIKSIEADPSQDANKHFSISLRAHPAGMINRIVPNESEIDIEDAEFDRGTINPQTKDNDHVDFSDLDALLGLVVPEAKACGICFGTGFVDTYRLLACQRIVLDNNVEYATQELVSCTASIEQVKPDRFDVYPTSEIVWRVELPTYLVCLDISVLNNKEDASGLELEAREIGGIWQSLDRDFFDSHYNTIEVRVTKTDDDTLGNASPFTHIQIILQTNPLPFLQLPQLESMLNADQIQALIQSEFELEPTFGEIFRESVIEVPDHHLLLKVTNVTNKINAERRIFGVTGSIRLVQSVELASMMRFKKDLKAILKAFPTL